MNNIYIFKDGASVTAEIKRLFNTHGPYTIEGVRLDQLVKVNLIADSSVSTIKQTGSSVETSKTGSMVGRAVTGAVLAGGVGAIVGGLSGSKEAVTTNISKETISTDITVELVFEDNSFLYVQIKDIAAFHWLLGFANQMPCSDDELEAEEKKSIEHIYQQQLNVAYKEAKNNIDYERPLSEKSELEEINRELHEKMLQILHSLPNEIKHQNIDDFVREYGDSYKINDIYIRDKDDIKLTDKVNYESAMPDGCLKGLLFFIVIIIFSLYVISLKN